MPTRIAAILPVIFARAFLAAAILLCSAGIALSQTAVVEVIPLRYRTAQEMILVIQPMLAREGSVSGFQGQLIVRTTPANLEEIKRILASVVTTVSGRLGEWMEIGGIGQDASGQQTVLLGRAAGATRDSRRVQVKVDEVP